MAKVNLKKKNERTKKKKKIKIKALMFLINEIVDVVAFFSIYMCTYMSNSC